jgi:preprotein translocase subunit SecD
MRTVTRSPAARAILTLLTATTMLAACSTDPTSAPTTASTGSSPSGPADLQLRPVLAEGPVGTATCPTWAQDAASRDDAVAACSTDGQILYSLGPASVTGDQISSASVQVSDGSAQVVIAFDEAGKTALSTITAQLAGKVEPQSQLAIYLHGRVQSAPSVHEAVTGGVIAIYGGYTPAEAQQIVDQLAVPHA